MSPGRTLAVAVLAVVILASSSAAQSLVGALAIDERRGDAWGWAVDYETAAAAQSAALRECGTGCSLVLTFGRCGAYAADQEADSTAVGWAESYASASDARQAALAECRSRGGSGCVVRVWGCNGQVVEEALGLDRAARRRIQEGLLFAGFDPGGADGLFGPRTRAAIREWQSTRGARATGYLDGPAAEALRSADTEPAVPAADAAASPARPAVPASPQPAAGQPWPVPAATAQLEGLFWQSIMNSTDPADFEAYLRQFPSGVFRTLAQNRLAALREPTETASRARAGGDGAPASEARVSAPSAEISGTTAAGDARRRPGEVFRDCEVCPEMVVMPGGSLALGRYEVTVGEYRAFASATSVGAGSRCFNLGGRRMSWRDPGFLQTDRHPVSCMSWTDARAYASWLSRTTGAAYRLPTEEEWERAAAGSRPGCHREETGVHSTCPVGSYGANRVGLSDMAGNVGEWTLGCWESDCGRRVLRGCSWGCSVEFVRPSTRAGDEGRGFRLYYGFRVARTLP